jgi:hypothetical protein
MSVESTRYLTRQEAIQMIMERLAAKIAALNTMPNTEIEDLLYALTRDTNYFENFMIEQEEL